MKDKIVEQLQNNQEQKPKTILNNTKQRFFAKTFWRKHRWKTLLVAVILAGSSLFVFFAVSMGQKNRSSGVPNKSISETDTVKKEDSSNNDWVSQAVLSNLPTCNGKELLEKLPVEWDGNYSDATPSFGHISTGGHPFPSDHGGFGWNGPLPHKINVLSPGNITVTKINHSVRTIDGRTNQDNQIFFMTCQQVGFYFSHIQTLSDKLTAAYNKASTKNCQDHSPQANWQERECYYLVGERLKTGEIIGQVTYDDYQRGFDFGANDTRAAPQPFANTKRYWGETGELGAEVQSVCAYDYFPQAVQSIVYSAPSFMHRPVDNKCGELAQDIPGTVQGVWFSSREIGGGGGWAEILSVVHDEFYGPLYDVISDGGALIGKAGFISFSPATSGTINREPGQTKVDGKIYCYQHTPDIPAISEGDLNNHHFLFQLLDSTTLKAEFQTGSCPANPIFSNPTVYKR
jgi:hypothetical protein